MDIGNHIETLEYLQTVINFPDNTKDSKLRAIGRLIETAIHIQHSGKMERQYIALKENIDD